MVHYVKGDLLESNCTYICHQVNCQGLMGSGIAKQIREKWPEVYREYKSHCHQFARLGFAPKDLLGCIDIVKLESGGNGPSFVINMYAQEKCGHDGKRYTSYDAFASALHGIWMVPPGSTIGFPKNIGCGLGGGNWNVISALIEENLGKNYEVYIYEL